MDTYGKLIKNEKGIAAIYIALILVMLVALAGIVIDFGYMYIAKGQLQNAADAAALAGAERLNVGTADIAAFHYHSSARLEAWRLACRNRAAGQNVFLVSQSDDCNSPPDNLNNNNDPAGDILLGHWDSTNGFVVANGTNIINAVQVKARRTSGSPLGQISLFLGKVLGFSSMGAAATATSSPLGLATPGIVICMNTCSLGPTVSPSNTIRLLFQSPNQNSPPPADKGTAWTSYSITQAPNIGEQGDVVDYIWGKKEAPIDFCNPSLCITTNNGVGVTLKELSDAFEDTSYQKQNKDFGANGKVLKWRVSVPVVDEDPVCAHSEGTACPPGGQGATLERYHVRQVALMEIVNVDNNGNDKGIDIDRLQCLGCINPPIRTGFAKLVHE